VASLECLPTCQASGEDSGEEEMKIRKHRPNGSGLSETVRQQEVQQEIESFLRALSSYPDRFARDPGLSFERHLFSISAPQQACTAVGDRRRS
jgi:hypothetical protein